MNEEIKTTAADTLAKMPGIKESKLVDLGNCAVCKKPMLGADITFYVVSISRGGFLFDALRRRAGLGMFIGSQALGAVMGPNEDLAKVFDGPHEVIVHEGCAGDVGHLLVLIPGDKT